MTAQIEVSSNNIVASKIQETPSVELTVLKRDMVAIHVPESIALRIGARLVQSEFTSVDEYASAVLETMLTELEKDSPGASADKTQERGSENASVDVFSKQDQEDIEDRLRGLGYM